MPKDTRRRRLPALASAAALAAALATCGCGDKGDQSLRCYVGGTMRPAMEKLAEIHKQRTGQAVEIDSADSGSLLTRIDRTREGDLYVCHDPFAAVLREKGLEGDTWTVATLTPAIAVKKGNPKSIQDLTDLADPDKKVKLGLTDEEYSTLGHVCPTLFQNAKIDPKVETRERSGGAIANGVADGPLDAGIVWNAVIYLRRAKLDKIDIKADYFQLAEGVDAITAASKPCYGVEPTCIKVTISTLACSKRTEQAEAFARFVDSPDGRKVFADHGFSPSPTEPTQPEQE